MIRIFHIPLFRVHLLFLSLILILSSCTSQNYSVMKDEKGKIMVVGAIRWEDWQKVAGWESYAADDYTSDAALTQLLKELIQKRMPTLFLFAGSWCDDSKEELPRLYKLIIAERYLTGRIILFGVDRQKREPSGAAEKLKIEKVPTLVVFADGREIGRIIEHPKVSWEYDLFRILVE
jgi:hypothetical protein